MTLSRIIGRNMDGTFIADTITRVSVSCTCSFVVLSSRVCFDHDTSFSHYLISCSTARFIPAPSPAVDSDAANKMMDLIRDSFVNGDVSTIPDDPSGIKLVGAEEFS